VSTDRPIDDPARRILRATRRGESLWLLALAVAGVYLLSTCWSFSREFGSTGSDVTVRAHPTPLVFAAIAAVAAGAQVLARIAEDAGASPFWWPRQARRLLIVLAFAFPVLLAVVAPALAILSVDAGASSPDTFGWLVHVTVSPGG
jgi:hypothetical protein